MYLKVRDQEPSVMTFALQTINGGFQLLDLIIMELKSHMIKMLKIQGLSLVEILFVKKKSFTRFALQSECCNFNQ